MQPGPGSHSAAFFVAAIENRAKEVGLAALDTHRLQLHLVQFVETSRSYAQTLSLLRNVYPPQQLVVVSTTQHAFTSGLNKAIQTFRQVHLHTFTSRFFL